MANQNQNDQDRRQQGGTNDGRQQSQQDQDRKQQGGADNNRQNQNDQRGGQR